MSMPQSTYDRRVSGNDPHVSDDVAIGPRVVLAAIVGNWLETFDFTVYGFFAVTIGRLYFPAGDATISLLLSVATFAVGFLTRPLGSLLIGIYGDRYGRKAALTLTIVLMALGTLTIALTPTYASIGLAAPLIIVLARLVQGFSQGGEFGAATTALLEIGSAQRRGLRASWQLSTQGGAALLGAGLAALLSNVLSTSAMDSWGWRVPFCIGALIAPVGLLLRKSMPDDQSESHGVPGWMVIRELFEHRRTVGLVTMMVMGGRYRLISLRFTCPRTRFIRSIFRRSCRCGST